MKLLKPFKRLKHLNVKPLALIGLAVLLVGLYFAFLYDPIQDIPPEFENIGLKIEPLVFEGRRVHFPYTDENNGESIIIKSNKKVYEGGNRSDVYFSVTNTGNKSEKVAVLSYFPKEYGDINYVDVWSPRERSDLNSEKRSDLAVRRGPTSKSGWRRLPLTRGDIKGNMTKLGKAFEKKKPVPDEFDVKAGIQFEISAGHTAYFKTEITYPFDKEGEFWFEAFGDQGGYGLLDPLFVGGTTTSKDTTPGWYSASGNNWDYRRKITIDKSKVSGTSNLSNFPVLVSVTYPDLRTTGFSGKAASGSGEFVFTSSDGTTSLPYEIETYSSSSGQFIGWVNVTTLSVTQDTAIYMYYGGPSAGAATNQNKTGTWDANYVGVWHLPNGTTLALTDSTSNALNGTNGGASAATAQIDGGASYNGTTNYSTLTNNAALQATTGTMEAWVKSSSPGSSYRGIVIKQNARGLLLKDSVFIAYDYGGAEDESTGLNLADGKWHHIAMSFQDGVTNGTVIYSDGIARRTTTITVGNQGALLTLGAGNDVGSIQNLNGTIDEVRFSNSARSSGWIATEYTNQSKPSLFYSVGGLESRTAQTVKIGQTTTSKDTTPGWYSDSWSYRKRVTIDKKIVSGTSNLSNFPILFSRTDNDFKHTSFGGNVASSSAGLTGGGGDFVFTSSDGTTKLDHEIEKYASSSGELLSWVEIPTLSASTDTIIYVYYGGPSSGATNQNKTGTWDSNYVGVWHLGDGDSTATSFYKDSTSNAEHGTMTDTDGDNAQVAGKIGNAMSFGGDSTDVILTTENGAWTNFTTCLWYKESAVATSYERLIDRSYSSGYWIGRDANTVQNSWGGGVLEGNPPYGIFVTLVDGSWHYICSVRSGTTHYIYGDGGTVSASNTVSGSAIDTTALRIANQNGNGAPTNATIDEVRTSNTALSADWIKTEYNNQTQAFSKFASFGGQQKRTSSTTKIGSTTTSRDTTPGWYSASGNNWGYRRKITIDKKKVSGTSNLSNFPVLVSVTYPDLRTTGFSGKAASGSGEFIFTSSDGTTSLPYEIETYSSSSGQFIGWVNVTTLSVTQDTAIYMYYGGPSAGAATNQNKTGTWDSNYKAVWHLRETVADEGTATSAYGDSTSNSNAGDQQGPDDTTGQIGNAQTFDGSNDYITVGTASGIDASAMSYSAWIYPINTTVGRILTTGSGTTDHTKFDKIGASPRIEFTYVWSSGVCKSSTANGTIPLNKWTHVVVTYDRSLACSASTVPKMYINGVAVGLSDTTSGSGGALTGTNKVNIGATMTPGSYFPGTIDDVRISATVRSADWIATEYTNQSKPTTFYMVGGLEKRF